MNKGIGQLMLENLGVVLASEIAVLATALAIGADYPVNKLLEAPFPLRGAHRAAEVLRGDDVRCIYRPGIGELDPVLLKVDRAVTPVRHDHVAAFPVHLVVRVNSLG